MQTSKVAENDAHVWWSYVWHEMKRKSVEDENSNNNVNTHLSTFGAINNEDVVMKLKENVRLQAIELASLRQETLSKRLQVIKRSIH